MTRISKKFLPLLFLVLPFLGKGQTLTDNFTDGDFTNNPTWSGDVTFWNVTTSFQLNSNGPAVTGTQLQLSTPSTIAVNSQWEFFVNPKVTTTSGNYMDIFLISDSANLKGLNHGYFVRVGGTPH